jgi:hypothetical protein
MGIEPHFNLWNYFFCTRIRQGSDAEAAVLCSVHIYVRFGPNVHPYFLILMADPPIECWRAWFLLRDVADVPLPTFTGSHPIPYPNWGYDVAHMDLRRLQPPTGGRSGIVAKGTDGHGDSTDLFQSLGATSSLMRSEREDASRAKLSRLPLLHGVG